MRYVLSSILLVLSMSSYAVQVNGLYTAIVAVDDQSQSARNAAIHIAIRKVVQKVSGRQSVLQNRPLLGALSNVSSYIEQFQYKEKEDDELGFWLTIKFQKSALDKVMQQFDTPVWGSKRPAVLVWFAVENDGVKYIVGSEADESGLFTQAALDVGLRITLPLLDIDDQRIISFNDVWAGFSDQILLASERYEAKQMMYGRLLKDGENSWNLNWTLMGLSGQRSGLEQADTVENILSLAFLGVSEDLANIYAPYGAISQSAITINVKGVSDLTEFVEVTRYLSSLDMVKKLNWSQVTGDKVELELSVIGRVSVLQDTIGLDNVLQPEARAYPLRTHFIDSQKQGVSQPLKQTLYYSIN
ncbi:MAG: hypothetical protein A6F72_08490 [Cycloclasticus sp. symbiont of Poecilosclerida sp. N]|nr:MAG: hypothetical protein A6F72_08490 [Cycloclasticus sp. symbiont of Poecilosclerida sp. N]